MEEKIKGIQLLDSADNLRYIVKILQVVVSDTKSYMSTVQWAWKLEFYQHFLLKNYLLLHLSLQEGRWGQNIIKIVLKDITVQQ